ncbi:MAG: M3 family metallopeptidase [Rhodanobacteraceae bacterium]
MRISVRVTHAFAGCALAFAAAQADAAAVPAAPSSVGFVAMPSAERSLYHADLGPYFPNAAAADADRTKLLADIAAFPRTAPAQAPALEDWLHRAEALLARLKRHDAYLQLRAAVDIDDHTAVEAVNKIGAVADALRSTLETALRGLGQERLARMQAQRPSLARYRFEFEKAERSVPHQLPPTQESILSEVADPALSGWWKLYQDTLRSTQFAQVRASNGHALDARKDLKALLLDPDRSVREAAWRGWLAGYAQHLDGYADILFGIVKMHDRIAHLRHYADAPSQVYFRQFLSRHEVDGTLAAVRAKADVYKHYQQVRDAHVRAAYGIADPHSWDAALPDPGFAAPRFTLDQTRANALAALAPLGDEYVARFRALLDPANHRMDVAAEEGRRVDDGFSVGGPGMQSALYVQTYQGYLGDSRRIIHEGGHAIHQQLMTDAGVSPFYLIESGPSWMSEAFAILNEFLLYDHFYRSSSEPAAKAYYLDALLNDMTFQVFGSAEEGTLEQSIYDGTAAGKIGTAADLDALTLATLDKFEPARANEPGRAHLWATKRLMYEDPLYLVNYLYAGLLATRMYEMALRDPADFRKRYLALLGGGFHAPPQQLLAEFFGHPVDWPQLVNADIGTIDARVGELERLYAQSRKRN